MGIFNWNYDQPGPGFDPDAPRKTGFRRMWEILTRDYVILIGTGLLALLALLPFIAILAFACGSGSLLLMVLGGLAGGCAAGPALCGLMDAVLCSFRDELAFRWSRYASAVRRNWKPSLLPCSLFGLVFAVEIFTLYHLPLLDGGLGFLLCQFLSMMVCTALLLYSLPQLVLMKLSIGSILKNSLLLSIRYFPRTVAAALVVLLYSGLLLFFLPMTSTILLLTNLWFPLLCSMTILYPLLDENFQVEERLKERKVENTSGVPM